MLGMRNATGGQRLKIRFLIAVLLGLLGPACSSQPPSDNHDDATRNGKGPVASSMTASDANIDFGSPGDPKRANVEILIEAHDSLRFHPEIVEVMPGDTVTFVVRNAGEEVHELVLGDEDYQAFHEERMDGEHAGMESNMVEVLPGRSARITWKFTQPGEVLFACHQPGHFDGGMVGTIDVGE